ncbi:MAG: BREX-1 system adenine-specific DNA-methyltransferase PglX [Spirosomataceae bacterium]
MNTKTFAQQARTLLMRGVANQLTYWGFDAKGQVNQTPQAVAGGYLFRDAIFDDPSVPLLWNSLRLAVKQKGIDVVIEEAAYTWFNRIMAIKILEKNGYDLPQIDYAPGLAHTPMLLQRARQGSFAFLTKPEQARLLPLLTDYSKDQEAFALLLIGYCHSHTLIRGVFGSIDDYTELLLPQNMLADNGFLHLLNTTDAISDAQYCQVELIGWLYQFYISEKKDEVFARFKQGKKAEAKDIPAATQIFTPNWIVKYMVQNTVGKLWLNLHPGSPLKAQFRYWVEDTNPVPVEAIITEVAQLTLLDPAAGSGHILVEGFETLYLMYREEYYSPDEAVESILTHNLFGLDIDKRAAQLARFAVLLKAATYYPNVLKKGWMPHIYCFVEDQSSMLFSTRSYHKDLTDWNKLQGMELAEAVHIEWTTTKINPKTKKEEEQKHSRTFGVGHRLNDASLELLQDHHEGSLSTDYSYQLELFWGRGHDLTPIDYSTFFYAIELLQQGKNIGSALKIWLNDEIIEHLENQYKNWEKQEAQAQLTFEEQSIWNTLRPMLDLLRLLCQRYTAVVANPPYMGQKSMNDALKNYVNEHYPLTKADLFAAFMEVGLELCQKQGLMGMINQHSWMFLSSFEAIRERIIKEYSILNMLHLGPRTFEELSGEVVQSTAFVLCNANLQSHGTYHRLVDFRNNTEKEANFLNKTHLYPNISQTNFTKIPGSPIAYWVSERIISLFENEKINKYGISDGQNITGNNEKYLKNIWEVNKLNVGTKEKWVPVAKGGSFRKWFGNIQDVIDWSDEAKIFYRNDKIARIQEENLWFREGITWNLISSGGTGFRYLSDSMLFNKAAPTILLDAENLEKLPYILGFLNTKITKSLLAVLNPTFNTNISEVLSLPLIELSEKEVAFIVNQNIAISKKDWDSRETSWDFERMPLVVQGESLRASYQLWQAAVSQDFWQLHTNEEELNRIFINIYGLADELTPDVPLRDITILQDELDRSALEQHTVGQPLPFKTDVVVGQLMSYAIGLFMGRYRLDKQGLNIAHPNPTESELAAYTHNGYQIEIDEDGIIPLMGNDCAFADDALLRIRHLLQALWGENTLTDNLNFLQACLDKDLERYLVKDFWKVHCSMYKKKPIYWLFSSAKGAFQVLVYMHRMNAFTVEKIRSNYLMEHLKTLRTRIEQLSQQESRLSTSESKQLENLHKNLIECEQYDLLLKNVADLQLNIDLDNGVTANYQLFEGVVAEIK